MKTVRLTTYVCGTCDLEFQVMVTRGQAKFLGVSYCPVCGKPAHLTLKNPIPQEDRLCGVPA